MTTNPVTVNADSLAVRYAELEGAVDRCAARVRTAPTMVHRVAAMAELASLEQESARLDPLLHGDDAASRTLVAALNASAWLLKMVAFTEDAPDAAPLLHTLDLDEAGMGGVEQALSQAAEPHLTGLAAEPDPAARAVILDRLADAVLPVAGSTAAETAAWLAAVARDRAREVVLSA